MKNKIRTFNDGFVEIYSEPIKRNNFGAKINVGNIDDLEFVVKLAYEECSKRQQDLEFAEASSRTLNTKVKTRFYNNIKNEYKVKIENTLYDIIYIDKDRKNRELYFYLEEVRNLE